MTNEEIEYYYNERLGKCLECGDIAAHEARLTAIRQLVNQLVESGLKRQDATYKIYKLRESGVI